MSNSNIRHNCQGVEILVRGIVQGVGFRPFIFNLANQLQIRGSVTNTGDGVKIIAYAEEETLLHFMRSIREEAPPLSNISSLKSCPAESATVPEDFNILISSSNSPATTGIPPDVAICEDCLAELLTPADPRFSYPFINCTNCGPRFTIVRSIPYDRPGTSMAVFPMCELCSKEYHDPANRRFHAQPNACPECGPQVYFCDSDGNRLETKNPIASATKTLAAGGVVGLRGLGGFHLVVDGTSFAAVERLRSRKHRPDKPLAVMVADLTMVQQICHLTSEEGQLLESPIHPIVLLKKKTGNSSILAENLASGIAELGIMLPYTPLHHLLFQQQDCPAVLVMTSGNISDAPICTGNQDGIDKLGAIVDNFLLHNREIVTRVDDSVVKIIDHAPRILRRARGYAPSPIQLSVPLPPTLGCGAGLKNTFCLGRDHNLFPSQHIGDLDNLEVYEFYQESIDHLQDLLQLEPEAVVSDLHPDYLSSRYAEQRGLPLYRVQHHHAHATAVMAEHRLQDEVLAVILDGTGLGDDNTIWGGELLRCSLTEYKRLGHLSHLPLPGGDRAAEEPWRMALSALYTTHGSAGLSPKCLPKSLCDLDSARVQVVTSMLENNFNAPLSSSCGRLFDAIAGLLGLRQNISFEGQAAMELETLARRAAPSDWAKNILPNSHTGLANIVQKNGEKWEISSPEFVKMLLLGIQAGASAQTLAFQFHVTLVFAITELVEKLSRKTGLDQVVLGGGCFQNSILLEGVSQSLRNLDLKVYTGQLLPANDAAISSGQTITGGLRHVSRNTDAGDRRTG